jgi:hypothetical protein
MSLKNWASCKNSYHIETDPTLQPVIHPPRKLPFSMIDRVQAELANMEKAGIISRQIKPKS